MASDGVTMAGILSALSAGSTRLYASLERIPARTAFLLLTLAALAPRLYFAVTSMAPVACDEIFQTVEVGHRIAFDRGFLSWEWREGVRSYIMPGFFALLYRAFDLFGIRDPYPLAVAVKTVLALLHAAAWALLFPVLSFIVPRSRAFVVVLLSALLYAGAFVSVRTLGEAVALPLLIASLFFAMRALEAGAVRPALWAGLLSGAAFAFRFQSAFFAAGLFAVLLLASGRRRALGSAFCGGALAVVLLVGIVDLVTWGRFLQSFLKYLDYNVLRGGASIYGESPWDFYFASFLHLYPPALIAPAIVALVAGFLSRRLAMLTIPVLLYAALHIAVPHKEVRFLFPAHALFGVIALFAWERMSRIAAPQYEALASVALTVAAFSLAVPAYAAGPSWVQAHPLNNAENMEPSFALGALPDIKKGVVLNMQVDFSGGHAYFHARAEILYVRGMKRSEEAIAQDLFSARPGIYFAARKEDGRLLAPYEPYIEQVAETEHWRIVRRDLRKASVPREVSLKALSRRQKEGAPWDAPGAVRLYGNGIRVAFGGIRHDTGLDIAVDHNDRYALAFMNGPDEAGRLSLAPRSHGHGLFAHRLTVPDETAAKGYDAVVIVPSEGDGVYSVGHLFLVPTEGDLSKP